MRPVTSSILSHPVQTATFTCATAYPTTLNVYGASRLIDTINLSNYTNVPEVAPDVGLWVTMTESVPIVDFTVQDNYMGFADPYDGTLCRPLHWRNARAQQLSAFRNRYRRACIPDAPQVRQGTLAFAGLFAGSILELKKAGENSPAFFCRLQLARTPLLSVSWGCSPARGGMRKPTSKSCCEASVLQGLRGTYVLLYSRHPSTAAQDRLCNRALSKLD